MHPIILWGIMSTLYLSPKTQHFSWLFLLEKWKLVHIKTCIQIFVLALLIITKNWKQYKFPLTSKSINKLWYNHARYTSKHKVTIYDMYQNLDKSQWYYAEYKKPASKGYILYDSIYDILQMQNYSYGELISGWQDQR